MSSTTRKRLILGVLGLSLALVGLAAVFGQFRYLSVCRQCGAVRDTAEWQIPFTRTTIFRHSSERDTAISRRLSSTRIIGTHEHQWLFVAGGGNRIQCAIGEGRWVLPSAESEGVAQLVEAAHSFGEVEFQTKLLGALFDPRTSVEVRSLAGSMPTNGFAEASRFHSWIAENMEWFDDMVAARKQQ